MIKYKFFVEDHIHEIAQRLIEFYEDKSIEVVDVVSLSGSRTFYVLVFYKDKKKVKANETPTKAV